MAEPKPALLDGQFEWRYLQRSYEKRQTQETQVEAEPALHALAMMHTRASDTSSSAEDGSNRQSDASLSDDGNDDENVVVEEEEDCDGTAEAPIATAGTPSSMPTRWTSARATIINMLITPTPRVRLKIHRHDRAPLHDAGHRSMNLAPTRRVYFVPGCCMDATTCETRL